jgi:hypothetical protein
MKFKKLVEAAFTLRPENQKMQEFLQQKGIQAKVKFQWAGSMKGTWTLYNPNLKWTPELVQKLSSLGFTNHMGEPLSIYNGGGGVLSVSVKGHNEFVNGATPPKTSTMREEGNSVGAIGGFNGPMIKKKNEVKTLKQIISESENTQ